MTPPPIRNGRARAVEKGRVVLALPRFIWAGSAIEPRSWQVNGTVVQEGGGNSVAAGYQVPNAATLVNLKVGDQVSCAGYTSSASSVSAGGPYFTVFTIAKH